MIELIVTLLGAFILYFGWFAYQVGDLSGYLKRSAVCALIGVAITGCWL